MEMERIERVILDIVCRDPYTRHLFATAAPTDPRIEPMLDPVEEEIRRRADGNTAVIRCRDLEWEADEGEPVAVFDEEAGAIVVLSSSYLGEDGSIDHVRAERAREEIERHLEHVLYRPFNQQMVFIEHFPLLWANRRRIIGTPEYSCVPFPRDGGGPPYASVVGLGDILRLLEDEKAAFRLKLPGGCRCEEGPVIVDYRWEAPGVCAIRTWCPACGARRTVRTREFRRCGTCDRLMEEAGEKYITSGCFSRLNLLDVISELNRT